MSPTSVFGYAKLSQILGYIKGKLILDYGCGTGKFSRVLAENGGLVIGVEPSQKMLDLAISNHLYNPISSQGFFLPFPYPIPLDTQFPYAVSTFVFCTMQSNEEMLESIAFIYNCLNPKGKFVLLDPHPDCLGHNFMSFRKERPENLQSGSSIVTNLEGLEETIIDYWHSREDYENLLRKMGFKIEQVHEPILTDVPTIHYYCEQAILIQEEIKVPPFIIIEASK
jgi:SAM-dependent methyltransferase